MENDRKGSAEAKTKIEAIYELREAVEHKVLAEVTLDREQSTQARDALLDATLDVEAKTQDAIESCHHCGRAHATDEPHERRERLGERSENVLDVDFRPQKAPPGN